jgi:hypothetical protein
MQDKNKKNVSATDPTQLVVVSKSEAFDLQKHLMGYLAYQRYYKEF